MSAKRMKQLGEKRSVIRELFEYGNARKAEIGADNVFDFSIGNPSVPPPPEVNAELTRLLAEEDPLSLHSYTSAPGDVKVRAAIADQLNRTYATDTVAWSEYLTALRAAIREAMQYADSGSAGPLTADDTPETFVLSLVRQLF